MITDTAPWPRLLACWQGGRLQTVLLHSDSRYTHARDEPVDDTEQLGPALADALSAMHRPVRHAVLVGDMSLAADPLRRRLGLATMCLVPSDRARRLAAVQSDAVKGSNIEAPDWVGAARALDLAWHASSTGAVCKKIRAAYGGLTRSERRVADVVLANPAATLDTATARLAEAAGVSQPQVIRFCRALGFDGLTSFKRALTESLATGCAAEEGHPLVLRSLKALAHVDRGRLAEASRLLTQAQRIDVLADTIRAPLLDLTLRTMWRMGLPARPADTSEVGPRSVWLSLGAVHHGCGVLIAEVHRPDVAACQLVTGLEWPEAPTFRATMMLQLLLAEMVLPGMA